ncbi:MAG: 1-(5-phosphoribosyl)-5-[(5-phosphoribosylamino)methylideneamino]imidazole-4-carboxamide isomerase [Lentisphaerae bacterium]|nr:1-(5-phosphoribosyl)-5-[(5-phosphoribosylamino)methylideneamino]imidazole-4-carboxamide isomerase [Lentisphaerota bacterium]
MPQFTIYPAIDLKDGRCVRLRQGRADDATVYANDPVQAALHWKELGARRLHVVDLDGAFRGEPVHTEIVRRIVDAIGIPVQLGGGLRTDADIEKALAAGVGMAIIGTRALASADTIRAMARRFGERLAVGIDARNGLVQVKGWVETTGRTALDLAREADAEGVRAIICTDTATDGMMRGPNIPGMDAVCAAVSCDVIASGGVSSLDDIRRLLALKRPNLSGAIVGKALYEGAVTLPDLNAAAEEG